MEVAVIGGAGTIGSTAAYTLAIDRPDVDLTLVDVDVDAATGHATDARHARTLGQLPQFGGDGTTAPVEGAPSRGGSLETADVAVIAASVPRPEGSAQRGGRAHFLERNRELASTIAGALTERDPLPVVVVSNPVDHITHHLWRETGWDRRRFVGYSLSETARTADRIATLRDVPRGSVYCPTVGEHGEHVVPLFSRLTIDGERVTLTEAERREVREYVRDVPYDVIDLRGAGESSRWVTGRGVARLAGAVLDGGFDGEPVSLSVPLDGEYGFEDVCLSVPVRLGRDGVERILEWDLADDERERLDAAYDSITSAR
ncbi:malate dehydrogenase [Halorarum salinum]|uniref:malate dehydrogenase n=1 Tax=Halorarum salinum TaxID=2743089 RepID=A0A7D5Q9D9_9EURY|nr:lactate dehydrogenase [Halobaculum salinum]QLG61716.1 lactate dehydrogenase [Halobaculum salinum]